MIKVSGNQVIKIMFNGKAINKLYLEKFELFFYFDYPQILKDFLNSFPEFKPLFKSEDDVNFFLSIVNKVRCLYHEFNDLDKCCNKIPFLLLVAHYLVMSGFSQSIGITASNGLVTSSSVGDVSVSFQTSPYSSKGDEFTYFMSLTPYGMQYLAWLSRQAGLTIVN
ncbi:TPA: DUF4054 domain-containing protein [Campylobacter jejuni]|nr:DUF4054 domain-containing protein [Campylobacter jejuni]